MQGSAGVEPASGHQHPCAVLSPEHLCVSMEQLPAPQSRCINEALFLHFKCAFLGIVLPLNNPGNVLST